MLTREGEIGSIEMMLRLRANMSDNQSPIYSQEFTIVQSKKLIMNCERLK